MKRAGVILILLLAFCGIADSAYLAQHEADGLPLLCNVGSISGCNIVATSAYSRLFGIPLADFGLLFYTLMFVLAAFELVLFNQLLRRGLQGLSIIGIAVSLYSVYAQVFVIQALCAYCLVSVAITFFVLVFASFIEPLQRKMGQKQLVNGLPLV